MKAELQNEKFDTKPNLVTKREFDELQDHGGVDEPPKNKAKKEKKEKKNTSALSLSCVTSRLKSIGEDPFPITLDPAIRDVPVTRDFMKDHYGGSNQSTYPTIGKAFLTKHGLSDFMYPKLECNPHAPQSPGAPGLLYRARPAPAYEWPKVQRLFIGLAPHQWLYVGQFKLTPAESLSKEEWLDQDEEFRKKWVKIIAKKGRGLTMRAKISLKKSLGRIPTKDELDAAIASEPKPPLGHVKFQLDEQEIEDAYDDGSEQIPIWCMKCVGYDEEFQKDVVRKLSAGGGGTLSNKGKSKKSKSTGKPKRTRRRRAAEPDSSSANDDESK